MADEPKDQDELREEEAAKRLDELAKRMLEMPPKPHKKSKPSKAGNGTAGNNSGGTSSRR